MATTCPSFFFFTILCLLSSTIAQVSHPSLSPSPSPLASTLAPTSPDPGFTIAPASASTFSPTPTTPSSTPTPTPALSPSPYITPSPSSFGSPLSAFSPPAPPSFSPSPSPSLAPLAGSSANLETLPASHSGLTGGQKAGISIAVIIGLVVAGVAAFIAKKRRENIRRAQFGRGAGGGAIRRDQL